MKSNRTGETLDDIVHNALMEQVKSWAKQGLSKEDIDKKLDDFDVDKMAEAIIPKARTDYFEYYKQHMADIGKEEKKKEDEFLSHQEQKWGKCFIASRIMYVIAIESAESYNKLIAKKDTAKVEEKKHTYLALLHIHGRVCQEFLEVYHLLRLGFADGAYARWRSMYELCCYGQFIIEQGEQIAKQYYEQSETEHRRHEWTKGAVNKDGKELNIVNFDKLQDSLDIDASWKEQYRLACTVNHGSPQGTFKRLANYGNKNLIPVGHSDYGIAMPAVNSAVTLAWISNLFFNIFPTYEFQARSLLLNDWVQMIRELYIKTEEVLFPEPPKSEEEQTRE